MTDPNTPPQPEPTPGEGGPVPPQQPYGGQVPPQQPPYGAPQQPPYGGQQAPYGSQQPQYGAPQYGGPQQQYGGQQQQYAGQPGAPLTQADDKLWASLSHFGGALGAFLGAGTAGWIAPLVIYLVFKDRGPFTRQEAKEALNFQLTITIFVAGLYLVGTVLALILIGFLLYPLAAVVGIVGIIFGIIGGVKVNGGQAYRYFFAFRMVK
ncbi:DUF4870 domain-containing protein [Mycetocola zhadangensis]|uniref:DUF4870 domain-containing protein n=1 Tax=Mycetocola zhadangensis TaxID=1164595 RepID=A0A3L7J5U7_9MICO|nr:DUF4870 domain-containing protein [Mycetocola zhadangensis]RLQ85996.1 DUF4870 domain-containing protein [Mycetocola zhadangensis]GGE87493.1 hypothetical protein GCM10011313_07620 [Mycetocola zhadangensis]